MSPFTCLPKARLRHIEKGLEVRELQALEKLHHLPRVAPRWTSDRKGAEREERGPSGKALGKISHRKESYREWIIVD